jgi:hypothetical protein
LQLLLAAGMAGASGCEIPTRLLSSTAAGIKEYANETNTQGLPGRMCAAAAGMRMHALHVYDIHSSQHAVNLRDGACHQLRNLT